MFAGVFSGGKNAAGDSRWDAETAAEAEAEQRRVAATPNPSVPFYDQTLQGWDVVARLRAENTSSGDARGLQMERELVAACAKKLYAEALAPARATCVTLLTLDEAECAARRTADSAPLRHGRMALAKLGFGRVAWQRALRAQHLGAPAMKAGAAPASREALLAMCLQQLMDAAFCNDEPPAMRPTDVRCELAQRHDAAVPAGADDAARARRLTTLRWGERQ
jgi:hypothetical protein